MKNKCLKCGKSCIRKYCNYTCWANSEERKRINQKSFKGKKIPKAQREKMALAKIGTTRSLEARKKNSESMKGHIWSTETLLKRAQSLKGKKRSGVAYQNIINGIAKAHGYISYEAMPNVPSPDYRGQNWAEIRKEIIKRDDKKCKVCGKKKRLQVHHIVPWRQTKDNSPENLITLCIGCHQSIKGKPLPQGVTVS